MYKMISPYQHKKDTIRPAHQTNDNTWANISVGGSTPNTFILFCPTARQRNGPVGAGFFPSLDYGRSSKEIYFKGYKERMSVFATSSFVWRRIVFWSVNQVANAIGPKKGGGDASVNAFYTRQMTPTENSASFRDFIFQGTDGTDYTANTLHHARVDRESNYVVMDKTYNINVKDSSDVYMLNLNHYYKGGRINYDDEESGSVLVNSSPWSVANPRGTMGNMYILDIFSDGGGRESNQQVGRCEFSGVTYMNES